MARARPSSPPDPLDRLVGEAPALQTLRAQIRHLARFDAVGHAAVPTVLLQGETGTGKGLVARVIHDSGPRAPGPFIEVNCAAIPETLLEAELFGVEAGAFTDAKRTKPGLFEAASGGTLFLDEIDALPLALQGKCLTAIETKRVRRLGAVVEQPVDVKLIAATQVALSEQVAGGALSGRPVPPPGGGGAGRCRPCARGATISWCWPRTFCSSTPRPMGCSPQRLSQAAEAWLLALSLAGQCAGVEPSAGAGGPAGAGDGHRSREPGAALPAPAGAGGPGRRAAPSEPRRAPQTRPSASAEALRQSGGNLAAGGPPLRAQPWWLAPPPAQVWADRPPQHELPPPAGGGRMPRTPTLTLPRRGGGETPAQSIPPQDASTGAAGPAAGWEPKPVAVLAIEVDLAGHDGGRGPPL